MTNIAIFVSGGGTNCENIIRHFAAVDDINVRLVVSNKPGVGAIDKAQRLGVPVRVIDKAGMADQQAVGALMDEYDIDFVVLAGYLLMAPGYLIDRYERRMLNIHPALLPKFGGKGMYGHHVHEAVRASGDTQTGITIHYVSRVCDGGEIVFQARTPVAPTDTPDDIAANIHVLEQRWFPEVIEAVIRGTQVPKAE